MQYAIWVPRETGEPALLVTNDVGVYVAIELEKQRHSSFGLAADEVLHLLGRGETVQLHDNVTISKITTAVQGWPFVITVPMPLSIGEAGLYYTDELEISHRSFLGEIGYNQANIGLLKMGALRLIKNWRGITIAKVA